MAASSLKDERLQTICGDIREQLFRKGTRGLSGVARVFRQADFNGNKKLDKEEFIEALSFCGLFLKKGQTSFLFNNFDRDGDGNINYDEFLHGIQLPLSADRLDVVAKAFKILDRDSSGVIEYSDVTGVYNAKQHPDVLEGKKTEEQVTTTFLKGFERGTKDGKISWQEFQNYYEDLGASIPSDEYFVSMMESCWKIKREGAAPEACTLGRLIGLVKKKSTQKTKTGGSAARTLQGIFKFFDEDESGHIKPNEFNSALVRLGIHTTEAEQSVFFNYFAGDDGKITISEFVDKLELDD